MKKLFISMLFLLTLSPGVYSAQKANGLVANFSCEGLACECKGDTDCNDMFEAEVCGDIAGCDEDGCKCLRI